MIASILLALRNIKADVARHLEGALILKLCKELNYTWRERTLGPVATVHAFLLQVLHGNTACDHVPHLCGKKFSGEAYGQARARLPLELFERLVTAVCEVLSGFRDETARWHGHRVWSTDGSSCSMPDTPELQAAFGQPGGQKPGCGFPVAHLLALFHAGSGILQRVVLAPLRTHDMSLVSRIHGALERGDVLVGDRGFCSYVHLAQLRQAGLHGVFRIHQKTIVDFRIGRLHVPPRTKAKAFKRAAGLPRTRWIRWQGHLDHVVEYFKASTSRPKWMTAEEFAALPRSLLLRELRYTIGRPGFRTHMVQLVTTLLDRATYPAEELARLYCDRWNVETNLRHLKQTLRMDVLRSKSLPGVLKEIQMLTLVYNLVRLVMLESAKRQGKEPDRISFVDSLRWLLQAKGGCRLDQLIVYRRRPGRYEPRVRKRRPKQYPLMKKPRAELKQLLGTKR
jgi:hypothetical protein